MERIMEYLLREKKNDRKVFHIECLLQEETSNQVIHSTISKHRKPVKADDIFSSLYGRHQFQEEFIRRSKEASQHKTTMVVGTSNPNSSSSNFETTQYKSAHCKRYLVDVNFKLNSGRNRVQEELIRRTRRVVVKRKPTSAASNIHPNSNSSVFRSIGAQKHREPTMAYGIFNPRYGHHQSEECIRRMKETPQHKPILVADIISSKWQVAYSVNVMNIIKRIERWILAKYPQFRKRDRKQHIPFKRKTPKATHSINQMQLEKTENKNSSFNDMVLLSHLRNVTQKHLIYTTSHKYRSTGHASYTWLSGKNYEKIE
ncbi:hypothetical protein Bhyg_07842 [Pseudolycoriella hygida]|uniref:Uncharacterized protein n=1 Tax=Pseudolycoriella hygida TaxID=35572 RepID=A0A9Q0N3S6_9DIPT|nr:hypothetical protein Bhyg_07842 [Pseudolycoriella hygida]